MRNGEDASGHGYLFPCQDTRRRIRRTHFTDDKPNMQMCRTNLANVKNAFEGSTRALTGAWDAAPDWFLRNKQTCWW